MLHSKYLPFTEDQLASHFTQDVESRIQLYKNSVDSHLKHLQEDVDSCTPTVAALKKPRQIEKDERFWTLTTLKKIFDSPNRAQLFSQLLRRGFGPQPPLHSFSSWEECLSGDLHLFFEVCLPSPNNYSQWLYEHRHERQMVEYVLDSMERSLKHGTLEGDTQVDALLLSRLRKPNGEKTSFAVIIEAKVLSDISPQVTFDMFRNQIVRNLDVMLEEGNHPHPVINERRKDHTLFCLLTPEGFREKPYSRFYGCLYHAYKQEPQRLQADLPHRYIPNCHSLARKLGWITFEDCNRVLPGSCPWLTPEKPSVQS